MKGDYNQSIKIMHKLFSFAVRKLLYPEIQRLFAEEKRKMETVLVSVMPGGKLPVRTTDGSIGYDTFARAIVSPTEKDPKDARFRKCLFDFTHLPEDAAMRSRIFETEAGLVYRMRPHESITVGIGFVTAMIFPMFYWTAPRSGLSSVKGVTVTNAPGTVDPDYRGEAGVLVYNRNDHEFDIGHHMRIAQVLFQVAIIPTLIETRMEELGETRRGSGGFGHTGVYGLPS